MAKKFWNVLVSIYYVSFLLLFLPPFLIYISSSNLYKRGRNKRKVRKIIKDSNMPKELRKEVTQTYKQSMKIFSIRSIITSRNLFGDSKDNNGNEFTV